MTLIPPPGQTRRERPRPSTGRCPQKVLPRCGKRRWSSSCRRPARGRPPLEDKSKPEGFHELLASLLNHDPEVLSMTMGEATLLEMEYKRSAWCCRNQVNLVRRHHPPEARPRCAPPPFQSPSGSRRPPGIRVAEPIGVGVFIEVSTTHAQGVCVKSRAVVASFLFQNCKLGYPCNHLTRKNHHPSSCLGL